MDRRRLIRRFTAGSRHTRSGRRASGSVSYTHLINALSTIIVVMITVVLILVNVVPLMKERKLKKNEKLG